MKSEPRLPPALRRELVRLVALESGVRRGLRWQELANGHWRLSCRTAFRSASPDHILADLERLPDGAGWKAAWEALFSWPESPF